MKLAHLLNSRRYLRCRSIFRHPLAAHVEIARARHDPAHLELLDGGILHVPSIRRCRGMFHWILSRSPNPLPVAAAAGAIIFCHGGVRLALRPDGSDYYIFKEIFLEDIYALTRLPQPLGTVVDLGGNIGLFTVRAALRAARVICVEPIPANLELARRNVRLNGLSPKVVFRQNAMAPRSNDRARIFLSSEPCAHSIRREHTAAWENTGHLDVPTINLPDLFQREGIERCSLLKCDIEGAEFETFRDVPPEILAKIGRIVMEVHFTTDQWNLDQFHALEAKLKSANFDLHHESLHDECGRLKQVVLLSATARHKARKISGNESPSNTARPALREGILPRQAPVP